MATQKIAITVPPDFIQKVDNWAKKKNRSRSRFIVEEINRCINRLEDEEITKLYDRIYGDNDTAAQDKKLTEEMLNLSVIHEEGEKW